MDKESLVRWFVDAHDDMPDAAFFALAREYGITEYDFAAVYGYAD